MSDVVPLRILARIEEEAAAWVWRLDEEAVSVETRAAFARWHALDPRHRRAFEELGGVWGELDAQAGTASPGVPEVSAVAKTHSPQPAAPKRETRRWLLPWAVAAALVAGLGTFAWLERSNEAQTLATAVGQQRAATLADGSVVLLNTNTILDTDFSGVARVVRMRKGEVAFQVAHDPQRPFLVQAGGIVVRAVGTQFNVRVRDARDVEVIVTEGKVDVTSASTASSVTPDGARRQRSQVVAASRLEAGQRFEVAGRKSPVTEAIAPTQLSNTLAWREGAVVFDGAPLAKAVAEVNRYSDTRLVVSDAQLNDLRVGGRFRAGDVEGFLSALTHTFPMTARRGSDNLIYLQARAAGDRLH